MSEFVKPLLAPFEISLVAVELVETGNTATSYLQTSRVYSLPGHYGRVLHSADRAGMLDWSLVRNESAPFSNLRTVLQCPLLLLQNIRVETV